MWGWVLAGASLCEWTSVAVHLALGHLQSVGVFWAVVGCVSVQPVAYYFLTVYFACFSQRYPNCLEKTFNVAYLYSLYIECLLLKLEPLTLRPAFESDGMTDISSTHRKQMLTLHVLTVSLPVEALLLYSSATQGFSLLEITTTTLIGLCLLSYTLYFLLRPSSRRMRRFSTQNSYVYE